MDATGVSLRFGLATDAGGRREVNEDAVLARPPLFCVADGMGGHVHGAMAAGAVVSTLGELADAVGAGASLGPEQLEAAVERAQDRIRAGLEREGSSAAAGSTLAGIALVSDGGRPCWLAFNVGDSRIYRHTGGRLQRISVDHSMVQELIDAGAITPEEALQHPQRNVITRAVGSGTAVRPDFWILNARPGERLLLCSDGLVGELSEERIGAVLARGLSPQQAAERLLQEAVVDGARDNVSAVVVEVLGQDTDEATRPRTGATHETTHEDTVPRPATVGTGETEVQ